MIVVTGGAGFIGSNLVRGLNASGRSDILVVDDLSDGTKFRNIADADIADYMDKTEFLDEVESGRLRGRVDAIFHLGACSSTTEWDGRYMMGNNYSYSKTLLHFSIDNRSPFIYASSASVYGTGRTFVEKRDNEAPLNMYGYSKFQFDQYVRRLLPDSGIQIAGFRYFNVYGPRESHKGTMSSVAYHFNKQLLEGGMVCLFEGTDDYADGEQRRDFIYVDDAVDVNLWFLDHPNVSGIFNVGTGRSQTFNDVARAVLAWHGRGSIEYIPFPEHLQGRYQSFTEADMTALRAAGYTKEFRSVEDGVRAYLDWLNA